MRRRRRRRWKRRTCEHGELMMRRRKGEEESGREHTPAELPSDRPESPRHFTLWLGGSFPDL
jgi:hypothetical protein